MKTKLNFLLYYLLFYFFFIIKINDANLIKNINISKIRYIKNIKKYDIYLFIFHNIKLLIFLKIQLFIFQKIKFRQLII